MFWIGKLKKNSTAKLYWNGFNQAEKKTSVVLKTGHL